MTPSSSLSLIKFWVEQIPWLHIGSNPIPEHGPCQNGITSISTFRLKGILSTEFHHGWGGDAPRPIPPSDSLISAESLQFKSVLTLSAQR